jgi:hypothetical protein
MNCPKCGATWPETVKFCGKCGTKLEAPGNRLGAPEAQVNETLKRLLPQIGLGQFREATPGVHFLQRGSTHVEVRVIAVAGKVVVRSTAPVTIGSSITQEMLQFLLNENANFVFGAFGLGPKGEIIFTHSIVASSLDVTELGASVSAVLNMADKYDDEIVRRWGGKTMKQTALDSVLAPALFKALLSAKVSGPAPATRPAVQPSPTAPATMVRPDRAPAPDLSQAIKVGSILEEYAHVSGQRCTCGGRYEKSAQALLMHNGKPHDQLIVNCAQCGQQRSFLFDISSFFGKR